MSVESILTSLLPNFDEDVLSYLISVVSDMSPDERKSQAVLKDTVAPFLIDSSFVSSQEEADSLCQQMSLKFGGSGISIFKTVVVDDQPLLLNAPIKMSDASANLLRKEKQTYGGVVMANDDGSLQFSTNSQYDSTAIPTNSKQARKMRKLNEQQQRAIKMEELVRQKMEHEMAMARMAAIKASRTSGRQHLSGLSLDRFSLPHPSGTGDLLTDVSLTLVPGRRYGLIGRFVIII